MLAVWKDREESGKAAPEAAAKAAKDADAEAKKAHAAASAKSKGGGPPTRDQVIEFYKEMGDEQGAGQTEDGRFCAWFHGMLSRKRSEELLQNEQDGTFLIRLAESRFGSVVPKHFALGHSWHGLLSCDCHCVWNGAFCGSQIADIVWIHARVQHALKL